jgi:trehalose/maltose transport system permease protein
LYEAARVDGAGKIKQFFSITFPLLKPSLAVALIFRTLASLRVFGLFQVLVGQQKYSMASYNYYQLIGNRAMGLASAISVIIFIIIFIFAVMYMKTLGVENE